jgi:hypothetical protein
MLSLPNRRGVPCLSEDSIVLDVMYHPWVRRLGRISQLGPMSIIYPASEAARYTRLEHSVGVSLINEYIINRYGRRMGLDSWDRLVFRLAGLLHDVGHGPMSHTYDLMLTNGCDGGRGARIDSGCNGEDICPEPHEMRGVFMAGIVLRECAAQSKGPMWERIPYGMDVLVEHVCCAILGKRPTLMKYAFREDLQHLLNQQKDSALDTDRLDYLIRDMKVLVEVDPISARSAPGGGTVFEVTKLVQYCLDNMWGGLIHKVMFPRYEQKILMDLRLYLHKHLYNRTKELLSKEGIQRSFSRLFNESDLHVDDMTVISNRKHAEDMVNLSEIQLKAIFMDEIRASKRNTI